jgi:hypothetical protein
MLHVISMHRPGDPRQTAVSTLSKVIQCLVAARFEHSTLTVRAKQHNRLVIATLITLLRFFYIERRAIFH